MCGFGGLFLSTRKHSVSPAICLLHLILRSFVQKAILNVPKDINLNFVSGMTIEQTFERTPDSTRIITKDDINVNFKLSEKSKGMYARRLNIYSNHSFDEPDAERALVFKESAPVITLKDAYQQSEDFLDK